MTLGDGEHQEPGWGEKLERTQQNSSIRTKSSSSALASKGEEGKAAVSKSSS